MEKDVTNEHESQSSNGLSNDELNSQYFNEFSNFDVMQVKVTFQRSAKNSNSNRIFTSFVFTVEDLF